MVRKLSDYLAQQARADADDRDLYSRSDARRDRKKAEAAWAELAETLTRISPRQLSKLELSEAVLTAVIEARRVESPLARQRAIRLVRKELREEDAQGIRERVQRLFEPEPPRQPTAVQDWCDRLASGEDRVQAELFEKHPELDRQRLRTLVRNISRATEGSRSKAMRSLSSYLAPLISAAPK